MVNTRIEGHPEPTIVFLGLFGDKRAVMRAWHKSFCIGPVDAYPATFMEVSVNVTALHISTGLLFPFNHAACPCMFIHTSVCVQISWLRGARTHARTQLLPFFVSLFSWLNHKEDSWSLIEQRRKEREREKE